MIRRYATELRALMMLADIAVTAVVAILLSELMFGADHGRFWAAAIPDPMLGLTLYVSAWVAILWLLGGYRFRARWSFASDARLIVQAVVWLALGSFAFLYLARLPAVDRSFLILLLLAQLAATVVARVVLRAMFASARRRGQNLRHIVVLGTGSTGRAFAEKLESHAELGLGVLGFLGDEVDDLPERWPYLGPVESIFDLIHEAVVDEVAICLVTEDWELIESIAAICEIEGKLVRMPVPMPRLTIATAHVEDLDGTPVLSLLSGPNAALALMLKRVSDVALSLFGIVVLSPLLIGIALAIKVTDGGPVIFRQERVGVHGRRFRVFKFRSMVQDADSLLESLRDQNEIDGHAFKMTADPRVTAVGRFLRRSSLDELPQLWNVVRGEMSLVGPRPPLPQEVAAYNVWHRRRLSMKPGITGLWQIEGRREPEFDRWVQYDLEYIDRWSPWLDLQIILRTIPAMIRAEGR